MKAQEIELEGTWDEIKERVPNFEGKRLRVTVSLLEDTPRQNTAALDEALSAIWQSVPESSWQSLPSDFASEFDHYLYGVPKRS